MRITSCLPVCDKLTISLSEDEIELDRIVQRAVVNKTALTTSPYQLPNQSQELFCVTKPPANKAEADSDPLGSGSQPLGLKYFISNIERAHEKRKSRLKVSLNCTTHAKSLHFNYLCPKYLTAENFQITVSSSAIHMAHSFDACVHTHTHTPTYKHYYFKLQVCCSTAFLFFIV